jgi:hypothetical protein
MAYSFDHALNTFRTRIIVDLVLHKVHVCTNVCHITSCDNISYLKVTGVIWIFISLMRMVFCYQAESVSLRKRKLEKA